MQHVAENNNRGPEAENKENTGDEEHGGEENVPQEVQHVAENDADDRSRLLTKKVCRKLCHDLPCEDRLHHLTADQAHKELVSFLREVLADTEKCIDHRKGSMVMLQDVEQALKTRKRLRKDVGGF